MDRITWTVQPHEGESLADVAGFHYFAEANAWDVTLRYQGREETFDYHTGPAVEATGGDLLECLVRDADYADLDPIDAADELGYLDGHASASELARFVREMHPAIVRNTDKLRQLFGADYDAVREVEDASALVNEEPTEGQMSQKVIHGEISLSADEIIDALSETVTELRDAEIYAQTNTWGFSLTEWGLDDPTWDSVNKMLIFPMTVTIEVEESDTAIGD